MQRYEKEVEEILHSLGCDYAPDLREEVTGRHPREELARGSPRPDSLVPARNSSGSIAERLVGGVCLLLVMAVLVLPFVPGLSAAITIFSVALLLVSLRHSQRITRESDLGGKDLRWIDVMVHARHGTQGTPRNSDDSLYK